jgi:hypothetical protein
MAAAVICDEGFFPRFLGPGRLGRGGIQIDSMQFRDFPDLNKTRMEGILQPLPKCLMPNIQGLRLRILLCLQGEIEASGSERAPLAPGIAIILDARNKSPGLGQGIQFMYVSFHGSPIDKP